MVADGGLSGICDNMDTDTYSNSVHIMCNAVHGPRSEQASPRAAFPRQKRTPPAPHFDLEPRICDRPMEAPYDPTVPFGVLFTDPSSTAKTDAAIDSLYMDVQLWILGSVVKYTGTDSEGSTTMSTGSDTAVFQRNWAERGRKVTREEDVFVSLLSTPWSSDDERGNMVLLAANMRNMLAHNQTSMVYEADVGHLTKVIKIVLSNMKFTSTFMVKPVALHLQFKMKEILGKATKDSDLWLLLARTEVLKPGKLKKMQQGKHYQHARPMWDAVHMVLQHKLHEFAMSESPGLRTGWVKVQELLVAAGKEVTIESAGDACASVCSDAGAVIQTHLEKLSAWHEHERATNPATNVWLNVCKTFELGTLLRLNTRADVVDTLDPADIGGVYVWVRLLPDIISLCFEFNCLSMPGTYLSSTSKHSRRGKPTPMRTSG